MKMQGSPNNYRCLIKPPPKKQHPNNFSRGYPMSDRDPQSCNCLGGSFPHSFHPPEAVVSPACLGAFRGCRPAASEGEPAGHVAVMWWKHMKSEIWIDLMCFKYLQIGFWIMELHGTSLWFCPYVAFLTNKMRSKVVDLGLKMCGSIELDGNESYLTICWGDERAFLEAILLWAVEYQSFDMWYIDI